MKIKALLFSALTAFASLSAAAQPAPQLSIGLIQFLLLRACVMLVVMSMKP